MSLSVASSRKPSLTFPGKVPKKGPEGSRKDNCPLVRELFWASGGVVGARWEQVLEGTVGAGMFSRPLPLVWSPSSQGRCESLKACCPWLKLVNKAPRQRPRCWKLRGPELRHSLGSQTAQSSVQGSSTLPPGPAREARSRHRCPLQAHSRHEVTHRKAWGEMPPANPLLVV